MARIRLEPLRGFRDIIGSDAEQLTQLINLFRRLARLHGYIEVYPPTLERFELFAIKSGEEIRNSMFVFQDKAGREVALRPEVTASIARIYLRLLRGYPKPVKVYYVANCFRYEEPQRARYREFIQAGIEIIGDPTIIADVEAIKLLIAYMKKIGIINHIRLVIGNTRIYRSLFSKYNIPEEFQDHILHLIDKKLHQKALEELSAKNLNELASLLAKLWELENLEQARDLLHPYSEEAAKAVEELREVVDLILKYEPNLRVEPQLSFARGLAYYTGIIFEVKVEDFPVSIAGGGRYDTLIQLYGGEPTPGTGFAIGIDRTLEAMKHLGLEPPEAKPTKRIALIPLDPSVIDYVLKIQDILVDRGYEAVVLKYTKLGKMLPKLSERGYTHAVIVGLNEKRDGTVTVRNLAEKKQVTVKLEELPELFKD